MSTPEVQSRHSSGIRSRPETSQSSKGSVQSAVTDFRVNPFGWNSRTSFDATQHLLRSRSESFVLRAQPPDMDVWKRPPPDFRPQCYAPKPPKRNSKEAMKPWRHNEKENEEDEENEREGEKDGKNVQLPSLVSLSQSDKQEPEDFVTRFRVLTPNGARAMFVRHGTYYPGMYQSPKPHDFRGVSVVLVNNCQ